jgi:5'-deoxynucleotidase YfbR-like HD superfamily hydrolase
MAPPIILTKTGRMVNMHDLKPEDVDIEDVAHALAMTARYGGHTLWFYSVAEHSVRVSELLEAWGCSREVQLMGLLHDAAEAYLVDMPSPIKKHLPDYQKLEHAVDRVIAESHGLESVMSPEVKRADVALMLTEMRDLTAGGIEKHAGTVPQEGWPEPLEEVIEPLEWPEAKQAFWLRYLDLKELT